MNMPVPKECTYLNDGYCKRQAFATFSLNLRSRHISYNSATQLPDVNIQELETMTTTVPSKAELDDKGQLLCSVADNPVLQKNDCSGYPKE